MKLYTSGFGSSPARVHMLIAERGLDIERVNIDLTSGEHKKPAFAAINPSQKVPSLQLDDGTIISESAAICHYLDSLSDAPSLYGSNAQERAVIEMWDRRMEFEVLFPMGMTFRHGHPGMKGAESQVPEYAESLKPIIAARLQRMDEELAGQDYIAGDQFSGADITAYISFLFFGKLMGYKPTETQTNLAAWLERVGQRPSTQGVLYR